MHVVNTDAKSHSVKTSEKCLQEAERGKKRMYLEACLQQRRHFSPFSASVDGFLGVEATATLKCKIFAWPPSGGNLTLIRAVTSRVGLLLL